MIAQERDDLQADLTDENICNIPKEKLDKKCCSLIVVQYSCCSPVNLSGLRLFFIEVFDY